MNLSNPKEWVVHSLESFPSGELEKVLPRRVILAIPGQKKSVWFWLRRIGGGLLLGVLVSTVLLFSAWYIFRNHKSKQRNRRNENRFDFIDDVSQSMNTQVDFVNASLDELEEALFKLENKIDQYTEKNGKDT